MSIGPLVSGLRSPNAQAATGPAASTTGGGGRLPKPGWPDKQDLDYLKTALELALLLLGIPYILRHLARAPGNAVARAGRKQLPPA